MDLPPLDEEMLLVPLAEEVNEYTECKHFLESFINDPEGNAANLNDQLAFLAEFTSENPEEIQVMNTLCAEATAIFMQRPHVLEQCTSSVLLQHMRSFLARAGSSSARTTTTSLLFISSDGKPMLCLLTLRNGACSILKDEQAVSDTQKPANNTLITEAFRIYAQQKDTHKKVIDVDTASMPRDNIPVTKMTRLERLVRGEE